MTHEHGRMSGPMVNGVTTLEAVKRTCDEQARAIMKEGLR
jgi:hypothetical protein